MASSRQFGFKAPLHLREDKAKPCTDQWMVRVLIGEQDLRIGGLTWHRFLVKSLYFIVRKTCMLRQDKIVIGSLSMQFLVDGNDTGGHMAMAEMIVQPKAKVPPPHRHADVDETIHVLEGSLTYRVDDEVRTLNEGDHCFSPHGSVHHFSNAGDVPARALVVFSPAKIGPAYFSEVAQVLGAGGPPDLVALKAVMGRHGLALAP